MMEQQQQYRIIERDFDRSILKGYSSINEGQTEQWKEFTKQMWLRQRKLYLSGYPCYGVGPLVEYEGFTLYEEFSKGAMPYNPLLSEARAFIRWSFHCGYDCSKIFHNSNYLTSPLSPIKKLKLIDVAILTEVNESTLGRFLTEWPIGHKFEIFDAINGSNSLIWSTLFLVGNVKNVLAHRFRKAISTMKPSDWSKSASIISTGD